MIFQQSLEILLTIAAEEEPIDLGTKLLEGKICRREDCSAKMVGSVVDSLEKTSLGKTKLECAELSGEE